MLLLKLIESSGVMWRCYLHTASATHSNLLAGRRLIVIPERERERERECVCVCVCVRERTSISHSASTSDESEAKLLPLNRK